MSNRKGNLRFKELSNHQDKKNKVKSILVERYNISLEDSEKILSTIEKRGYNNLENNNSKYNQEFIQSNKSTFSKTVKINNSKDNISQRLNNEKIDSNNIKHVDNMIKNSIKVNNQKSNEHLKQYNAENQEGTDKNNKVRSNEKIDKNRIQKTKLISKNQNYSGLGNVNGNVSIDNNFNNVDSILKDIIPDYPQQVSVKIDHVDLTFEVQNEKIDTLKEKFIRTIKRDTTKKIKIHALKDVSFQIYKGEKVGIIGFNGAGKSTLLNVITGIYIPDKGTVTTFGKISPLLSLGAGFDFNFSGRKNIILNGAVLGYGKEFLESKIDEIIEFSELGEFIDIPIKNYSSGMLAKLGFSIATAVDPDILIIDEILGVGDVNFQRKSSDKIKSLMDGNTTVILVSHSLPQIRELCDKAIWIDNGSIKSIGEVNKVCDEYLACAEKASTKQLENIKLK